MADVELMVLALETGVFSYDTADTLITARNCCKKTYDLCWQIISASVHSSPSVGITTAIKQNSLDSHRQFGEEAAVDIKAGMTDYALKDRLSDCLRFRAITENFSATTAGSCGANQQSQQEAMITVLSRQCVFAEVTLLQTTADHLHESGS